MRKVATVAVAMTLCLSLMGLGYAWWSENLHVRGTVNTGSLNWEFKDASVHDMTIGVILQGDRTNNPAFNMPGWTGKDVARGTVPLISADRNTVTFTLENTYPGYLNALTARVRNIGTLPLRFDRVLIMDHNGVTRATITGLHPPVNLDLTGEGTHDIAVRWGDNLGRVLGLNQCIENTFEVLVLAGAPQSRNLSFSIELVGVQFNAP